MRTDERCLMEAPPYMCVHATTRKALARLTAGDSAVDRTMGHRYVGCTACC